MICYRDRTYCSASYNPCINKQCMRFLSKQEMQRADDLDLPIAFANLSVGCKVMVVRESYASE